MTIQILRKLLLIVIFPGSVINCFGQIRILHYTETSGFDHQTRTASFNLFNSLAGSFGYQIVDDSLGNSFDSLFNLQSYNIVIFSNTSGDAILDSNQRSNFEDYIAGGGNVLAIHSATDTYRHSMSNGTNTGTWDFFPELIGASVQQNPNHVNGTPVFSMQSATNHPLLYNIPSPWTKAEEYYYWENGYYDSTNNVLLTVEATGTNSYDSSRATTWYRTLAAGNRIFYTSLGHEPTSFDLDTEFQQLMKNALQWCAGLNPGIFENSNDKIKIWPNPFAGKIHIEGCMNSILKIYAIDGRLILQERVDSKYYFKEISGLPGGLYIFSFVKDGERINKMVNHFIE